MAELRDAHAATVILLPTMPTVSLISAASELRPAVPADAEAGAALHAACWREAYAPYADPALLAERLADTEAGSAAWTRQLVDGPPRVLAEADGELVGFAVVGANRDPDATDTDRALRDLHPRGLVGHRPRPAALGRRTPGRSLLAVGPRGQRPRAGVLPPQRLRRRRRPRVLRRPRHLGDQDGPTMSTHLTYFDLADPTFDVTSAGGARGARRRAGTSRPTGAGRCSGTPR